MAGRWRDQLSGAAVWVTFLCLTLLCLCALFLDKMSGVTVIATIALTAAALTAAAFVRVKAGARARTVRLVVLAGLCVAVKLAVVLLVPAEPLGDYRTFYITARDLAAGNIPVTRNYLLLFPHVLGYAAFLAPFLRIFGESPMAAAIVNVGLSLVSMLLLHYISRRLFSEKAAVLACLCWIFFPSQTFYNVYVLSEPLYTALILAALAIIVRFYGAESGKSSPLLGIAVGALLCAVQLCRPIALIIFIALAGYVLIIRLGDGELRRGLIFFALAAVTYSALLYPAQSAMERYLGGELGGVGYSIYVGFNEDTGGQWDQADSDRLYEYFGQTGSAKETQKMLLNDAKERVANASPGLFKEKLKAFMCHDYAAVKSYGAGLFPEAYKLTVLCDGYYNAVIIFAAIGAVLAIRRRERSPLIIITLYAVGLAAAHMLVEVAPRYHYSMLPILTVLAAGTLAQLSRKFARRP